MLYYYQPVLDDGIFYSCDNVRLAIEFRDVRSVDRFLEYLDSLPGSTFYLSLIHI